MANFQQEPAEGAQKPAAVATAISAARRDTRRGEPMIDEGLRLIKAFRQIADPTARRRLVEQAEDLAQVINGKS